MMKSDSVPIVSITPNPALDLGGFVDQLLPDEKNYVRDETRFPGGNGINAARIIHRLGFPVVVSGFLGRGVGGEIRDLIEAEGLNHKFIPISGPARISVTVSTRKSHHQTRLSFTGPTVSQEEYMNLLDYLREVPVGSLVVLGGSLPSGIDCVRLQEVIAALFARGCECVVDLPGPILKEVCLGKIGPLLIKPNLVEFQQLTGQQLSSRESVVQAARVLANRISLICVSSVEGGAVLVSSHGAWFGQIPEVKVKSSVGAGDSMVGAMCAFLKRLQIRSRLDEEFQVLIKKNGDELLRWGLAAACATLTVHGTQLGSAEDIKRFLSQIEIKAL